MHKWTAQDRYGNEIYLTQERWEYILRYHAELTGLIDDLLDTLKKGRRTQEPADPGKYKYCRLCDALPFEYNAIVGVVKFSTSIQANGVFAPNNFVVTAWGTHIHREG